MTTQTVSTTARPASNFWAWTFLIGGIACMPFTEGLSFGLTLLGGFMMRSPDPAQPDETVNDMEIVADAVSGKQGCTGCLFGWLTIITVIVGFAIFAVCIAAAAGGGA